MTADPIVRTDAPNTALDLHVSLDLRAGVVRVAGELDRSCAHHLADAVLGLAASASPTWTIDLGDVSFCDVEGLRVLHRAQVLAATRRRVLRLRHVPPTVAALLPLVGPAGRDELLAGRERIRLVSVAVPG